MVLVRIHRDILLNPDELVFVRFEDMDQGRKGIIRFRNGGSETIMGDAVQNLLGILETTDSEVEPIQQANSQPSSTDSGRSSGFHVASLVVPTSPFIGRNKAWFHRKDENGRQYFLAVVNAKGSCSLRTFDAENGLFLGKHYRSGNYHEQFSDLIKGATELTVNSQPNLERDCKQRLPDPLFAYLRNQIL